jgi:hypothetical protein
MDINLPILKSDALVVERSECSDSSAEAELEDETPDACKNNIEGENECAQITVIVVGSHPLAKIGIVTRALWRVESWELVANDSIFLRLDTTPTGAEIWPETYEGACMR